MTAQVITDARFVTPERVSQLRSMGIEIAEHVDYGDLDLPEPGYGEQVIGELTTEEAQIFAALCKVTEEQERASREMVAETWTKMGEQIRSNHFDPQGMKSGFASEEAAMAFYRRERTIAALHSTLYFSLCERFELHHYMLRVRSRGRVVKGNRRY